MTNSGCRAAAGVVIAVVLASPRPVAAQSGPPSPDRPATAQRFTAPVVTDTGDLRGPRQPIFFRHDVHAGQDRVPCMYCHYSAAVSSEPGLPAVETCMGCHRLISGSTPSFQAEIAKVVEAFTSQTPPQWIRVHTLPGFVRFPHMRHIKALGTNACTTCHGDVQTMPQVHQVSTLRMGWCVRCHEERKVSRDCTLCHY